MHGLATVDRDPLLDRVTDERMGEPHGSVVELLDQRAPRRARLQVELRREAGRPNRARRARPSWSASGRAETRAAIAAVSVGVDVGSGAGSSVSRSGLPPAASTRASTRSGDAEPRRLRTNLVAEPGFERLDHPDRGTLASGPASGW